ncbi:hypothetical protein FBU30_005173 [Linnemannia zychae]|nr:hypothetical protein FBU30_005173 [Linnemannia zychae]
MLAAEAATLRRGHSGTPILDQIYFVGGLATAAATDTTPIKSITSLNLLTGDTSDKELDLGIYNHAASTAPFGPKENSVRLGLSFGQTTGGAPSGALDWLSPVVGDAVAGINNTSTPPNAGQPLAVRSGHSMIQFNNNNLWVLGGYLLPLGNGTPANPTLAPARDTPMFDYSSNTWSNQTKGALYRFGHASALLDNDNILTCYGTIIEPSASVNSPKGRSPVITSDCVNFSIMKTVFSETKLTWANNDDRIVGGLIGHTMVASSTNKGILYMFGGTNEKGDKYNTELYKLDATNLQDIKISKVPRPDDATLMPSGRTEHVAVVVGVQESFMVVHGGMTGLNTMADANPYYFRMGSDKWLDLPSFILAYKSQLNPATSEISSWTLIAGIIAGVSVLGAFVAWYIWRGVRKDTAKRLEREREAADRQSNLPDFAAAAAGHVSERKQQQAGTTGRTPHPIYGMIDEEDHSLSNGPFKSTSSLIQSDDFGKSNSGKMSKPWVTEPASPGGTTLTENGSINGYMSSASSQTPSRLVKKGSNASSQNSMATRNNTPSTNRPGGAPSDHYYNPRDLYLDEDDDSSITVSLASESSLASPWNGPVRLSNDLAPPNPRFSRGAIPQAHRQLVDALAMNSSHMPGSASYSNRNSSGWDTSSPGGSLSSRDDEYYRRSVNSMQWVSFEPLDPGRPESQIDPLSQRSNLTVRNASMYRSSLINIPPISQNPRMSMFGGSNTSDTNTEDSGSYYGPGGKRISTALAARQQRRSMRNSQDSLNSVSARHLSYQQQQQQQQQYSTNQNSNRTEEEEEEDVFVTKVLPIVTSKVTKPTLAKVVTQQRGSRIVVPSAGLLSDQRSPPSQMSEEGSLGIDFTGFSTSQEYSLAGNNVNGSNNGSNPHRTSYQTRRTSNLNPNPPVSNSPRQYQQPQQQQQQQRDSTNVILKMPPAPKHPDPNTSSVTAVGEGGLNPRSQRQQQEAAAGVRNSILEMGQDLTGYF